MKILRYLMPFIVGLAIGFGICYLNSSKGKKALSFVIASKNFEEDSAYEKLYEIKDTSFIGKKMKFSQPVDTTIVSEFVRNFKDYYPSGSFSFVMLHGDLQRLMDLGPTNDIRVYFGLKVPNDPNSGTVILTSVNTAGVNPSGGDVYIPQGTQSGQSAIDQASPCPTDCPYTLRSAVANPADIPATGQINPHTPLNKQKSMLGRRWGFDSNHGSDPRQ